MNISLPKEFDLEYSKFVERFGRPDLDGESTIELIGFEDTIASIRDRIETLLNSESSEQDFALITGPSGTGKTTFVRQLAAEHSSELTFFYLKASWTLERQFGNPESRIRLLFDEAVEKAPSLIFIDKIDLICAEKRSQNDIKDRVFNVLEDKLESLNSMPARVLVLAATDRPEVLDPQIRKPCYFSDEIKFALPKRIDRIEVLKHLISKQKNDLIDEQIEQIADASHCYSYRDLSKLCNTALKYCRKEARKLRGSTGAYKNDDKNIDKVEIDSICNSLQDTKIINNFSSPLTTKKDNHSSKSSSGKKRRNNKGNSENSDTPKRLNISANLNSTNNSVRQNSKNSCDYDVTLTYASLKFALSQFKPIAIKSLTTPCPPLRWEDIGGVEAVKKELQESVIWPLEHREKFQKLGICSNKGAILYGPPGCSKTMLAQALATESGYNFISVKGPELFSKWVGDSEAAVRRLYRNAREIAPCIIFFDEIDGFAPERSDNQSSSVGDKVVAQLLTELNGIEPLDNVFTIAATNRPDRVDSALLRPGRLDPAIYIPLPSDSDRHEIFKVHMRPLALKFYGEPIDSVVGRLVAKTHNYSGAEIANVCRVAGNLALRESLENEHIELKHFEEALEKVRPRTRAEHLKAYKKFQERSLQLCGVK